MNLSNISSTLIAQSSPVDLEPYVRNEDVMTLQGLEGIFANIVRVVVGFGAVALFIMLIVGGFSYITAGGDPQKSAAARATITHAIMGITLIASALMIIRIIEAITGADLTVFQVYRN